MTSSIVPFTVRTCGSDLDTHHPHYARRFKALYRTWLGHKLGMLDPEIQDATIPICRDSCSFEYNIRAPLTSTTPIPTLTPSWAQACVRCLYHNQLDANFSNASLQAVQKGGGCSLCVSVVAPWAFQKYQLLGAMPSHDLPLPQNGELYDFIHGDTFNSTIQAFQNLTECQRAGWVRKMCGQNDAGTTVAAGTSSAGQAYVLGERVLVDSPPTPPPVSNSSSSGLTLWAWVGIICAILIVFAIAWALYKHIYPGTTTIPDVAAGPANNKKGPLFSALNSGALVLPPNQVSQDPRLRASNASGPADDDELSDIELNLTEPDTKFTNGYHPVHSWVTDANGRVSASDDANVGSIHTSPETLQMSQSTKPTDYVENPQYDLGT